MPYSCKNRRTGALIRRTDAGIFPQEPLPFRYYLYCMTHQTQGPGSNRLTDITKLQRHPWKWCDNCKRIYVLYDEYKNYPE